MPSPMQSQVFHHRKSPPSSLKGRSAASYLTAVVEADAKSRKLVKTPTLASTPALSFSSTTTSSSDASSADSSYPSSMTQPSSVFDDSDLADGTGLTIPLQPPSSAQVFHTVHSEFGHCDNQLHRHTSRHPLGVPFEPTEEQDPPYYILITTYISFVFLICLGHLRDFLGKRWNPQLYSHLIPGDGYAAFSSDFDSFYTRRLKSRLDDCFSRPVTGVPGRTVILLDRVSVDHNATFHLTGKHIRGLNVSSYNYLGFAQTQGGCADAVETSIGRYGLSSMGGRMEGGTIDLHVQAEALVARFVGHEDSIISSMGFATNSTTIPALVGRGSLVISDEYNHASIRYGVRVSGAQVRMFKHNDMEALENLLREVISQGQPKTHRPWKKILLVVEGLYSMEGTLVNLPAVVALKQKYKFYLYVDEAHSIGALGPHGRGVCDYFGVNPRSIDILMGTFTKSFGAAGGYIAGPKPLIAALRIRTHAGSYAEAMSPVVLTQVIASMGSIMGVADSPKHLDVSLSASTSTIQGNGVTEDSSLSYTGPAPSSLLPPWLSLPPQIRDGSEGRERLRRLAFNVRYLSRGLKKLGFITYGHEDSPVIPVLLFNPGKMRLFSRLMLEWTVPIVIVVVAYPATPLVTSRVRFCLSASHVKTDVDMLLRACDKIGDLLDLKHGHVKERWTVDKIIDNALQIAKDPSFS